MLTLEELPVEAVIMSTMCSVRTYYNNDGKLVCHSDEGVAPAAASTKPQAPSSQQVGLQKQTRSKKHLSAAGALNSPGTAPRAAAPGATSY